MVAAGVCLPTCLHAECRQSPLLPRNATQRILHAQQAASIGPVITVAPPIRSLLSVNGILENNDGLGTVTCGPHALSSPKGFDIACADLNIAQRFVVYP
eukprot:gene42783-53083_t